VARAPARIGSFGKSIRGWSDKSQITNPQEFHPRCRPEEVFDAKSGSCIPITNVAGSDPVGTLECPEGFILNHLGLCSPETPQAQAQMSVPFAPRLKDIPKNLKPKDKESLAPLDGHGSHHEDMPKKKKKKRVYAKDLLDEIRALS
jgi:hypothetical protein